MAMLDHACNGSYSIIIMSVADVQWNPKKKRNHSFSKTYFCAVKIDSRARKQFT